MEDRQLEAGFAAAEFTPEIGLTLLGQMHERRGERVRDPLLASALALRTEVETVALVSVDICVLTTAFVEEIQARFAARTGLPARCLLLHATHTHVAPSVVDLLAARADPAFVERLREAILAAAEGALARLEPVHLFAGTGRMEQMGWNRRAMFADGRSRMYGHAGMPGFIGLEGPRDPALGVLCARNRNGDLRGVLVSFSTHPNAIEGDCVYSADIPGEARRVLRELFGPDLVVVYLTGASGNTAPSMLDPYLPEQPWRGETGLVRSGLYLGSETAKVIASCFQPMASPELRLEQTVLQLPVRRWPRPDEPTYPEPLASDVWSAVSAYYKAAAEDWPRRLAQDSLVPVRLSVLRVGEAVICMNPAELFVEYGMQIREASPPRVTLIAELTDGYVGYVPTLRAFERGGYETWPAPTSQLVPEAGEEIVRATRGLLEAAFGRCSTTTTANGSEAIVCVTGLDHVQLAIPPGREAEARRFYGALLGMIEVPKPAPLAARGGCWFESRGTVVHLGVEAPFAPARKAHPALRVADLEECRRRLEAAGTPIVPDNSLPDLRRFYAADPFGNRIELIQDGDGFAPS